MAPKPRIFGEIPGITPGDEFTDREELSAAGLHPPNRAGISGSKNEGADSIVLSGGYEDDEDHGDIIIYTGEGGQDEDRQVADQTLTRKNLALARNKLDGLPVRVTRGYKHKHPLSPSKGYRYCGLYYVDDYWLEKGKAGFNMWRFRLVACTPESTLHEEPGTDSSVAPTPSRKQTTVNRIVRDPKRALNVKLWHKHQCQVCGIAIQTSAGLYSEAAHIQGLGAPHNGPDIEENMLCLCPNHHVMFDNGGFTINDDLTLEGIPGKLRTVKKHKVNMSYIQYHREHHARSN